MNGQQGSLRDKLLAGAIADNIGELGHGSIRIGDQKIEQLPMAELAHAKAQLPLVYDTERQNKINNIVAGAPKASVAYLTARIRECEENIKRVQELDKRESTLISEYTTTIAQCEMRDKQLAKATDPEEIEALRKMVPPYNVERMQQQVKQSTESKERAQAVIAQEYASIAELRETLGLCMKRDADLRSLGVKIV